MPVVTNGKSSSVGSKAYPSRKAPPGDHRGWNQKLYCADTAGVRARISVYGDTARLKVEENLAAVRAHFGVNVSDAMRISLHLTANAIRNNRAMPEIE